MIVTDVTGNVQIASDGRRKAEGGGGGGRGHFFGPVPAAKSLIGSPMSFPMQEFFIAIQRAHKWLSRLISQLCAESQQHLLGELQAATLLLLK